MPIALGYIPIAIAFGALAMEARLRLIEAALMSVIVFAGASQFMAVSMVLAGAGGWQIIAATLFINLRHLVMSMAVHNRIQTDKRGWRVLLSFGVTDETFALLTMQLDSAAISPWFAAGLMGIAYLGWVGGTLIGGLSAQVIPARLSASMTLGLYALFIGLLMPQVRRSLRIGLIAAVSMAINAVLTPIIAPGWAIVIATTLGALFGAWITPEEAV